MAKKISNRKFSEMDAPLQSVTEESNLGYKTLIQDENEIPTSHHRKRFLIFLNDSTQGISMKEVVLVWPHAKESWRK